LIFECIFPNAVGEFIFDQSSAHGAFAKDALNAKEMNVNPGGNQCHMHSTLIPLDNPNPQLCGMPQTMVFPDDLPETDLNYHFHGQPNGMHVVLKECGLLEIIKAADQGKIYVECQFCKPSYEIQEKYL